MVIEVIAQISILTLVFGGLGIVGALLSFIAAFSFLF
jgi:hypothetical protein